MKKKKQVREARRARDDGNHCWFSEHGFGPASASAQEVTVTEGKIARLRQELVLAASSWRTGVRSRPRCAPRSREQRESEGLECVRDAQLNSRRIMSSGADGARPRNHWQRVND